MYVVIPGKSNCAGFCLEPIVDAGFFTRGNHRIDWLTGGFMGNFSALSCAALFRLTLA